MARRAAGLVIFRQGGRGVEWLLLQTSYGQNHWTPPKGHLDPGEDDMMAAMRETEEEAGLGSDHLEVFRDVTAELKYEAFGKPKVVTYWLAKLRDPDQAVTLSEEHQDLRWLPCEEAAQLAGFKEMARVIRDFQEKVVAGQL
eukprot:TRINITY_DN3534_c0_g1_i3.p1 TRINITY_DN3534_c0_g1~~TRINITY_DN3534_c0_g1_i3.p1  ORF type:complete len:142 (-),score=62.64 TRINITY_DN3534_c0_g1_i3:52-477(-)